MESLERLPSRLESLETQILQLRTEMRSEFSAIRGDFATMKTDFAAIREEALETRRELTARIDDMGVQMRVLHEDVISRIAMLGDALNGPNRKKRPLRK